MSIEGLRIEVEGATALGEGLALPEAPLFARLKHQFGAQVVTIGVRLIDLPLRYGMHVLIALKMNLDQMGAFYIAFGTMMLVSGFGRLGVDRALIREMAQQVGQGDTNGARATFFRGLWLTSLLTAVTTGAFAASAWPISHYIMHKPGMVLPFLFGALAIVPQNYANLCGGALAGLQRVTQSQIIYTWAWPAGFCAALLLFPLNAAGALLAVTAAMGMACVAAVVMLWRAFPARVGKADAAPAKPSRQLLRIGCSLFSWEAVNLAISGAPPFVLGALSTTSAVALYAIAWRVVLVVYMFISSVGSLVAPRFARHFALGELAELKAEAARGMALSLGLAAVPIALLTFAAGPMLGLFGPHFAPAVWTLRILIIGQCAATLTATTPELLGMTGYDRSLLRINAVALVVLMVTLVVACPRLGAEGAALATSVTMVVTALATTRVAKASLGFTPLGALLGSRSRRAGGASATTPPSGPVCPTAVSM